MNLEEALELDKTIRAISYITRMQTNLLREEPEVVDQDHDLDTKYFYQAIGQKPYDFDVSSPAIEYLLAHGAVELQSSVGNLEFDQAPPFHQLLAQTKQRIKECWKLEADKRQLRSERTLNPFRAYANHKRLLQMEREITEQKACVSRGQELLAQLANYLRTDAGYLRPSQGVHDLAAVQYAPDSTVVRGNTIEGIFVDIYPETGNIVASQAAKYQPQNFGQQYNYAFNTDYQQCTSIPLEQFLRDAGRHHNTFTSPSQTDETFAALLAKNIFADPMPDEIGAGILNFVDKAYAVTIACTKQSLQRRAPQRLEYASVLKTKVAQAGSQIWLEERHACAPVMMEKAEGTVHFDLQFKRIKTSNFS
jgi:hypothetical protein